MSKKVLKYVEVADWLRSNIHNGTFKAGDKLISEHNLCAKLNISRHTARSAIDSLENDGIVIRKQGSGTFINTDLNGLRKTLAVLLTDPTCYSFPIMISGIESILSSKGHATLLAFTNNKVETERNQLLSLLASNVDGLIAEAVQSALANPNIDIYREFIKRRIPVIFINSYNPRLDTNYIVNDDVEGARIATEHLIEKGHQKIGGIFKMDSMQGSLRYEGFINKLYEKELKLDENRIIWYTDETLDDLFSGEKFSHLKKTLSNCTAVLCYSDRIANELVKVSDKIGLSIPEDISIASFDDSALSKLVIPTITSVTHPGDKMGKLAAESLLKMLKNDNFTIQHTYKPTLVIRDSVKENN